MMLNELWMRHLSNDPDGALQWESIQERKSKIWFRDLLDPNEIPVIRPGMFPPILAGSSIETVVDRIIYARKKKKPIIFCMGGHVVKCGLSRLVVRMFHEGYINYIVTNGAGVIHDVELSLFGHTSEYVEKSLPLGKFGFAKETHNFINQALEYWCDRPTDYYGYGEAIYHELNGRRAPNLGIFRECGHASSVAVGIGTDIVHMGRSTRGDLVGKASLKDFRRFTERLSGIAHGGVVLNFGSAVILPEVLLKALSIRQNQWVNIASGYDFAGCNPVYFRNLEEVYSLKGMVAANFDFIQSYRGNSRVVDGAKQVGGEGYSITGHHEILLPLLYGLLKGRRG
jgi:hypothetical protein